MSTIAAISTPVGVGGIGIIRVSGEDALRIADTFFVIKSKTSAKTGIKDKPLLMRFGSFAAKDFTDTGYAVYFPADKAYTGEDTVEFYLHGGVRIMQGALDALLSEGARHADRGEFTKRAYLNGRLSLADAEGVIDMINAESAAGLRAAYRLMEGRVAARINEIADSAEELISSLEASLDYPDEMEDEVLPSLPDSLKKIAADIDGLLSTARDGKIAKHGLTCVLAGAANAGKSSLMNAMLKEERAIVTSVAGTTRDTIAESFECDGVKINIIDTAGIRESDDEIEKAGIARARAAYEGADVIIRVVDTASDNAFDSGDFPEFEGKTIFTVYNKCDKTSFRCPRMAYTFAVSAKTGEGVEELKRALASLYRSGKAEGGEIITSERHISALYRAKAAIKAAIGALNLTTDVILVDLREAYDALGEITGRSATEDIIAKIFERFCVGK